MNIKDKNIKEKITQRKKYLERLIMQKKDSLEHAPDGSLRGTNQHGGQYFHRKNKKEKNGTYIPVSQQSFAKTLGQKMYDQKILQRAENELNILLKLEKHYKKGSVETIYASLPESHQRIVDPIELPDKDYIEKWLSVPYEPKPFSESAPEYYTDTGIRVRSKSEILIGNLLTKYNIPYLYEKPLMLKGYGVVHPDFTLLDLNTRREVYYEHMGMMDDSDYREHALAKIACYEQNNILPGARLLLSFETGKQPINMKNVEKIIAHLKI